MTDISSPIDSGAVFKSGVAKEILSISLNNRNARLTALADAYPLAKKQANKHVLKKCYNVLLGEPLAKVVVGGLSGISAGSGLQLIISGIAAGTLSPPLAGTALVTFSVTVSSIFAGRRAYFAHKSMKDVKDIKELTAKLLLSNDVQLSEYLDKIDFSKMELQKRKHVKISPMRNGKSSSALPVNSYKSKKHLLNVFEGNPILLLKLNAIINNRENYFVCPNADNTDGGEFSEKGWRNILSLCVNTFVTDQVQTHTAADPAPQV